ncbi:uncharacterized protein [Diabrotica undecimpunctata]|uniref:uncharacterized protein n=1 Tax=Diabrotica undecimpunctata TaxID=50387 RepID=UPI003B639266
MAQQLLGSLPRARKQQTFYPKIVRKTSLTDTLTTLGTHWHFIPAYGPHFGGLWESAVKILKYHLKKVIGDSSLTYETLSTVLAQIEACMNSRHVCVDTEDTENRIIITPGHVLIGRELISSNREEELSIYTNMPLKWRQLEKVKRDFWNSWRHEYFSNLQQRYKWQKPVTNLEKEEMVIIKEDGISPGKWPLAKIIKLHPGAEGLIRVATVQKENEKVSTCSIHKLIPIV